MRIDVNQNCNTPPFYGIPPTNPFRRSRRPADDGVGQGPAQSVSLQLRPRARRPPDRRRRPGRARGSGPPASGPGRTELRLEGGGRHPLHQQHRRVRRGSPACNSPAYTPPILDYGHTGGRCSITGGYRYRGTQIPGLAGAYVYADYCTGEMFAAQQSAGVWTASPLLDAPFNVSAFGEDEGGEIYVASYNGNAIHRIVSAGPTADLAISKTDGQSSVTAGQPVTYTITASNAGPTTAYGATVADTFPASLGLVNWTCAATGGASCCAITGGDTFINRPVLLPPGGTVTYTATGTLNPAATGTLSNTATVTAPASPTDPVAGNNSATDTDTIIVTADLSITKNDGVSAVQTGQALTYTIVATNMGPSPTGATVTDTVPADLTGATWTCTGSGGGTCTVSGSGTINDAVSLPVGASVTYLLSGTVDAGATGTLANTTSIATTGGVVDPDTGNNAATDADPVVDPHPRQRHGGVGRRHADRPHLSRIRSAPRPISRTGSASTCGPGGRMPSRWTTGGATCPSATPCSGCTTRKRQRPHRRQRQHRRRARSRAALALLLHRDCDGGEPGQGDRGRVAAATGASACGSVETTLFCPWFISGERVRGVHPDQEHDEHRARDPSPCDSSSRGRVRRRRARTGSVPANGSFNLQVSAAPPDGFGLAVASGRGLDRARRAAGLADRERHLPGLLFRGVVRHAGPAPFRPALKRRLSGPSREVIAMRSPSRAGVVGLRLALVVAGLFGGRPAIAQGVKEFLYVGNRTGSYRLGLRQERSRRFPQPRAGLSLRCRIRARLRGGASVQPLPLRGQLRVGLRSPGSRSTPASGAIDCRSPARPLPRAAIRSGFASTSRAGSSTRPIRLLEKIKGYSDQPDDRAPWTPLAGTGFVVANNVNGMAQTPSGRYLYAATVSEGASDFNSRIYGFAGERGHRGPDPSRRLAVVRRQRQGHVQHGGGPHWPLPPCRQLPTRTRSWGIRSRRPRGR